MAKITTNSTSKEILEIAMPHVNKLYEDFQKWGKRNKKMLKEKTKQSKIFDLKCAMDEEEDGVIWYLVPNNMSWNQGRLTMPDGYRPCCWFRDVVTQLEYGASVGTHCTLMYSPHCLKRVRERLQIPPTKSNFETFRDMMFYTANAIQVKGAKKYGTTNKSTAASVTPIGVFFGWCDPDKDLFMCETFVRFDMLGKFQKYMGEGSKIYNCMAVKEYVRQGQMPRSVLNKYSYDKLESLDLIFIELEEDHGDVKFLTIDEAIESFDEYAANCELRIAEEQANRTRWKKKMLRKGYN